MKIVVLDESKKRKEQISEILEKKKIDVVCCSLSGEFIETVEESTPDQILMDVDSWSTGRAIYNYFGFNKKLENVPILFYNAPENFVTINSRKRHNNDRVLNKPSEVESIVQAIL